MPDDDSIRFDDIAPEFAKAERAGGGLCKLMTAAEFLGSFVPPSFLVHGIIVRKYLYSLTAKTGHGKTTVLALLAVCVAMGWQFAGRAVRKGRVLFLCGENDIDLNMKIQLLCHKLNVARDSLDVVFTKERFDIGSAADIVRRECNERGPFALVIVDTAAAYFPGGDENSNVEMGNFARDLRRVLTSLDGDPAVIVSCHPVKVPQTRDQLLPRGGGAFIAEVDGNLSLWSDDDEATTMLGTCGKFRGPPFDPIAFAIERETAPGLASADGVTMTASYARPLSDDELKKQSEQSVSNYETLLMVMHRNPKGSLRDWAVDANWTTVDGKPRKYTVEKICKTQMVRAGTAEKDVISNRWVLTKKGTAAAKKLLGKPA
jgi:hypothetical protein